MRPELSIIIPANNEKWLARTVQDALEHAEMQTEIICVIDGNHVGDPIPKHQRITLVELPVSLGQRAATNAGVRLSRARYVMKVDAHSLFSKGFDKWLISACETHATTVCPMLRSLYVREYQCEQCGIIHPGEPGTGDPPAQCPRCRSTEGWNPTECWKARPNYRDTSFRIGVDFEFRYWPEYLQRPEGKGDRIETMMPWGGGWLMERTRYEEIGGLDERFGSVGMMATEIGCKSWLSGGRVISESRAAVAHLFRASRQLPYRWTREHNATEDQRSMWLSNSWKGQVRPLSWLLDKFKPVPEWHDQRNEEALVSVRTSETEFAKIPRVHVGSKETYGIVYYTDNTLDPSLMAVCQQRLLKAKGDLLIICVSLCPTEFGDLRIVYPGKRGYLSLHRQIAKGIEEIGTDWIFLAEHDCLYCDEHFQFHPGKQNTYWYNNYRWCLNVITGENLSFRGTTSLSNLCGHRSLLLPHFNAAAERIIREGENWLRKSFIEPGRVSPPIGMDNYGLAVWSSPRPNIDLRCHGTNWTSHAHGWSVKWGDADGIPGWGKTKGRFQEFLADVEVGKIP